MSHFTTRIELHGANESDYTALHAAMIKEGFSRTIKKVDQPSYHLPTAEYNEVGDFTIEQILERAKKAAGITNKKYGVLVTKSEEARAWFGLEPVK